MKVIEEFLLSKTNNPQDCEDAICVTDDFAAVIDGATSMTKWNNKKSGKIASELLTQAVQTLPRTCSLPEAFLQLNEAIRAWYKQIDKYEYLKEHPQERPSAQTVLYSSYHNQLGFVGDCQALIGNKHITNRKLIDYLVENVRAFYLETAIQQGKTIEALRESDPGREYILPLIRRQSFLQNTNGESEYVYYTLDGFFERTEVIKIIDIPKEVDSLVLASDGYPILKKTLKETEKALQEILEEDPLCFRKYKSAKALKVGNVSFDDRAYLKISI